MSMRLVWLTGRWNQGNVGENHRIIQTHVILIQFLRHEITLFIVGLG
jgi:hypothetical protein